MRLIDEAEQLNAVISDIYAATLDKGHWTHALKQMDRILDTNGTVYVRAVGDDQGVTELPEKRHSGMPRADLGWQDYLAHAHLDPRIPYSRSTPPMSVFTEYDFITDDQIDRHPFYQDFMAKWDLRYTIGSVMPGRGDDFLFLASMRSPRQEAPDGRDLRLGQIIACHVGRSSEIERRIAGHVTMQRALMDSLDQVPDGLFITRVDGRLLHANKCAENMLEDRNPFVDTGGVLRPIHRDSGAAFQKMLGDMAQLLDKQTKLPTAMRLPGAGDAGEFQVRAMPLTGSESRTALLDGVAQGAILIVVSGPNIEHASNPDRLALLFDLTPAEARLAAGLANGLSLDDISNELAIAKSTVRWTLKRLKVKTDCSRQTELVRLFSTAAASW